MVIMLINYANYCPIWKDIWPVKGEKLFPALFWGFFFRAFRKKIIIDTLNQFAERLFWAKLEQDIKLTLDIQWSRLWRVTSNPVFRHTLVFSAVCPVHIRYCQLLVVLWKTDPGIDSCIYRRSIYDPWYCWYWICRSIAR